MAKVYLETSFFSACVTTRTTIDSQYWKSRSLSWLKTQAARHDLYISIEVVAELSSPAYPQSESALKFTAGMNLLPVGREVIELAEILVDQKVMPGPREGDATHVAAAAYYGMDYLLSWNVKHLANPNKRIHLARILMSIDKAAPMIVTPDVLWEGNRDE